MFSKWGESAASVKSNDNGAEREDHKVEPIQEAPQEAGDEKESIEVSSANINTILKGSKLTGDINVTCDLELTGDVEGNIKSVHKSNIVIKGTCKGNIETREGSVDISGELENGNIIAGNNVSITGRFSGGDVRANGRISVNGEFNGKLEGNEIEIGANARGKGEIFYKEYISIAKGAKVEVQISKLQEELKVIKNTPDAKSLPEKKVVDIKPSSVENKPLSEVK